MQELNPKEAAVLGYIRQSISHGVIPSVREIGSKLAIKSTSSVHRYLTGLQNKGYILREGSLNRCIRLPGDSNVARVPVLGTITAGQPILAVESIESYVPIAIPGDTEDLFALHVCGESMIKAGIFNGDIIVARRCSDAVNGDIVVALIDDEATVKRFFKEDNRYRLQPENDTMSPIYADQVTVLGKVVALQRIF